LCCTLCRRQFTSPQLLLKHEQQSDLHKKNLQVEEYKSMLDEQQKSKANNPLLKEKGDQERHQAIVEKLKARTYGAFLLSFLPFFFLLFFSICLVPP
jgi:hypothetical protein